MAVFRYLRFFLLLLAAAGPAWCDSSLSTSRWGEIRIFGSPGPSAVPAILLSDRPAADGEVQGMIKMLIDGGASVAVIQLSSYLDRLQQDDDESCYYLAGEFERISQVLEQKMGLGTYQPPILIGIGEGATYAAIVSAQHPSTFSGVMLLGFCPRYQEKIPPCREGSLTSTEESPERPLLLRSSGEDLPPMVAREAPECGGEAHGFFGKSGAITFLDAGLAGRPAGDLKDPRVLNAFKEFAAERPAAPSAVEGVSDLPVVEIRADRDSTNYFVLFLSGDGGWAAIDKEIGARLSGHGIDTVGLDCLRYFWAPREEGAAANDLARIIRHYRKEWHKESVYLIGFSFGADVLPRLYNALPSDVRSRVHGLGLLSPSLRAKLEVHLSDWVFDDTESGDPVLPEARRIREIAVACVYGEEEEDDTVCRSKLPPRWTRYRMPGSHHFDGDYEGVAKILTQHAEIAKRSGAWDPAK